MTNEFAIQTLKNLLDENSKLAKDKLNQMDNLVRITGSYKDVCLWTNYSETHDRITALEKAIDALMLTGI